MTDEQIALILCFTCREAYPIGDASLEKKHAGHLKADKPAIMNTSGWKWISGRDQESE